MYRGVSCSIDVNVESDIDLPKSEPKYLLNLYTNSILPIFADCACIAYGPSSILDVPFIVKNDLIDSLESSR